MKELMLEIEVLEERIAPSFIFASGSNPDSAGADPIGGAGGGGDSLIASFGPDSTEVGTLNAWIAHDEDMPTPLDNGGNA